MDRVAELALPTASLITALLAVRLWRRTPKTDGDAQGGRAGVDPPVGDLVPEVDWGILRLTDTQLVGVWLESDDLVVDLFGGMGSWRGYAGDRCVEDSDVSGTAMLTLRASFANQLDLAALERLETWAEAGGLIDLELEVDGSSPLAPPRRVMLRDGDQAVALTAPA